MIELKPYGKSFIPAVNDFIDGLHFLMDLNGMPQFTHYYPEKDGIQLNDGTLAFDRTGVKLFYKMKNIDKTPEEVENYVNETEKEYEEWLKTLESAAPKFNRLKRKNFQYSVPELKKEFEKHGIILTTNETVEMFNAYKDSSCEPAMKEGIFARRYNEREQADFEYLTDYVEKFRFVIGHIRDY